MGCATKKAWTHPPIAFAVVNGLRTRMYQPRCKVIPSQPSNRRFLSLFSHIVHRMTNKFWLFWIQIMWSKDIIYICGVDFVKVSSSLTFSDYSLDGLKISLGLRYYQRPAMGSHVSYYSSLFLY